MKPHSFEEVRAAERAALGLGADEHPTALCLSGGGIRSASFGIGVLQAFAKYRQLGSFHYLSTVSGGGFAGSWLTGWIRREGLDSVNAALARCAGDPGAEPAALRHLRRSSRYLAPRAGVASLDSWTLAGRYVTNLLITWLILLPALMAILAFPRGVEFVLAGLHADPAMTHIVKWVAGGLSALLAFFIIAPLRGLIHSASTRREWRPAWRKPEASSAYALAFGLVGVCGLTAKLFVDAPPEVDPFAWRATSGELPIPLMAAGFGALFGVAFTVGLSLRAVLYSAIAGAFGSALGVVLFQAIVSLAHSTGGADGPQWWLIVWLGPVTPFITFFLGTVALGVVQTSAFEGHREALARWGAGQLRVAAFWLVLAGYSLAGPRLLDLAPEMLASLGGVSGVAAWAFSQFMGGRGDSPGTRRALWVYSALLWAVVSVVLALVAWLTGALGMFVTASISTMPPFVVFWGLALALLGLAVAFGWLVDINASSLHGLYRFRLVRAWLGASRDSAARRDPYANWLDADVKMSEAWSPATHDKRLYPVVNLAVNDLAGNRLDLQDRKALTFPVTCQHAGYDETFRPAESYAGGLSLGQAIAISGAAVNPAMGFYSSVGLAAATTLLNARMGVWVGNPASPESSVWKRSGPRVGLWALLQGAAGRIHTQGDYVHLSDGGHVDNLGLYEMVRRGCRRIVVVDGGADPQNRYPDLTRTLRNIRIDLGVVIDIAGLDPAPDAPPVRWAVGRIRYLEGPEGHLIYLRPDLLGDEPLDVRGYAAGSPAFPHESTADQFFSEQQFESYRALGQHTVASLYDREFQMPALLKDRPPLDALLHLAQRATSRAVEHAGQPTHAGGVIFRRGESLQIQIIESSAKLPEWVLPKGRVHAGELPAQTAQREALEEAGAVVSAAAALPNVEYAGPAGAVRVANFLLEFQSEVEAAESRSRRWVSSAEALELLTFPEDRAVVAAAVERLTGRVGSPESRE